MLRVLMIRKVIVAGGVSSVLVRVIVVVGETRPSLVASQAHWNNILYVN